MPKSETNEAVAIAAALRPTVDEWERESSRSCVRMKKMTVASLYDSSTRTIGVREAFSASSQNVPCVPGMRGAAIGSPVWVQWLYGDKSTMCVVGPGDISEFYDGGVNPNILDNGFFFSGQFPINQRGSSSYSGAKYGIDRWESESSALTVNVTGNGVQLVQSSSAQSGYRIWTQKIEDYVANTYTLSLYVSAISGSFDVFFGSLETIENRIYLGTFSTTGLKTVTGELPSGITDFAVSFISRTDGAASVTISAVKLERGLGQTLMYRSGTALQYRDIPNFQEQLLRCQRYQYPLLAGTANGPMGYGYGGSSTLVRIFIQLPTPLYKSPTATFLRNSASSFVLIPSVTSVSSVNNINYEEGSCYLVMNLTVSGATTNTHYILRRNTADVLFDANP